MSKEKTSIFKKMARLNSKEKDDKDKSPKDKKKSKKRKIILWSIWGVILFGGIAGAIGTAYAISAKKSWGKEKFEASDKLYTIKGPDGKIIKDVTFGEIIDIFNKTNAEQKEDVTKAESTIVKYLYNEEFKAYELFQKALDVTVWADEDDSKGNPKKFDKNSITNKPLFKKMSSEKEIREKNQKNLDNEKKVYQKKYGPQWLAHFNDFLSKSDKYGKTSNETEALDFLTIEEMKKYAYARYEISINNQFTRRELEQLKVNEDVKDGETVVFKKGQLLFEGMLEIGNNVAIVLNDDRPDGTTEDQIKKETITAFISNSYVKSFVNPKNIINQFYVQDKGILKGQFNFYELVKFNINITQNASDSELPWTISKDSLKELSKFIPNSISDSGTLTKDDFIRGFEAVSKFKGALNLDDKKQEALDKKLFSLINPGSNRNSRDQMGKTALRNLNQIFDEEETSFAMAFLNDSKNSQDNLFAPKEAIDVFNKIYKRIIDEVITKDIDKKHFDINEGWNNNVSPINFLTEKNKNISRVIDQISDADLSRIGQIIAEEFTGNDPANPTRKISTIYKFNDDFNLLYSNNGFSLVNTKQINTLDSFDKELLEQMKLSVNNQYNKDSVMTLNVSSLFNQIKDPNFVLRQLLEEKTFVDLLLESDKEKNVKWTQTDIDALKKTTDTHISVYKYAQASIVEGKAITYINDMQEKSLNVDYDFNDDIKQWVFTNKKDKDWNRVLWEKIQSIYKLDEGDK